jgi:hypothetical protein
MGGKTSCLYGKNRNSHGLWCQNLNGKARMKIIGLDVRIILHFWFLSVCDSNIRHNMRFLRILAPLLHTTVMAPLSYE